MNNKSLFVASIVFCLMLSLDVLAADNRNRPYVADAPLSEQLDFVIGQSSRWETYRVVPETWLNQLRKHTLDSISGLKTEISNLQSMVLKKESDISSLNNQIDEVRLNYEKAVKERDSFSFMGILMRKGLFVSLAIFMLVVMGTIVAITFLLFQKANMQTAKLKKELADTMSSYEAYRQDARRKQETLVIQHHKEIQRLKGLS